MLGLATILIVDDERNNVDYLEQELEGFGYSTISASNGADALAILPVFTSKSKVTICGWKRLRRHSPASGLQ